MIYWKSITQSTRFYSTNTLSKPLLLDILPSKKVISKLLFDFDARYNFNKYLPVIESIYDNDNDNINDNDQPKIEIPNKFMGNDLLIYQRVLAQIRKQTHTINPHLLKLENKLIEQAAQHGSRDALCTLSFMALDNNGDGWTENDKSTAKKYIKELMKLEHPLAFKLAADRELKGYTDSLDNNEKLIEEKEKEIEFELSSEAELTPTSDVNFSNITSSPKQLSRAVSLYQHFLKLDSKSTVAAAAYRSLGMIYFRTNELTKSKENFENAIKLAPATDNPQAHFFLGLLNEDDPMKSRYHFQMAASEGFRESFANLGYIELNVFKDLFKAREWFALGAELGVNECVIGLFDVSVKEENWKKSMDIINRAEKQGMNKLLLEVREETVSKVKRIINEMDKEKEKEKESEKVTIDKDSDNKSRWDL